MGAFTNIAIFVESMAGWGNNYNFTCVKLDDAQAITNLFAVPRSILDHSETKIYFA